MPPSDPSPARDRPGGSPVDRLTAVLAAAGGTAGPSADELAELVWLARHMGPAGRPSSPSSPSSHSDTGIPVDVPPPPPPLPRPAAQGPARPVPPAGPGRVPLRLPAEPSSRPDERSGERPAEPSGGADGTALRVPVPPMIPHPLPLQRALRPLGRRVPAPDRSVLDEGATAHRIAALGAHPRAWLPVLRPADERWLRLSLVYDDGPTMPVWRPLVRELHTALAQSGLFRTVELHRAAPDGTVPPRAAEVPATGRAVTLVVSDCMGPQWRPGAAGRRWYRTLRRWAGHMPLAVLQPLPERLWPTTALPAAPGLLTAPHAAAPSTALDFSPYDGHVPPSGAVPVPVLEVAPTWLAHWATLVASGAQVPGAAAWLGPSPARTDDGTPREDVALLSPEELVLRFRSTASPEAFRLAGHLAVGRPHLPVMRLVHAAVSRQPRPQHLAEVVLSGMLTGVPGGAPGAYAFRDGVREVLLGTLPRSARGRTRQLLARVGGLIDERAGVAPGVLRAVAGGTAGGGEPFAEVSEESVRRLGGERRRLFAGRYQLLHRPSSTGEWVAQDTRNGDAKVLIRMYSDRTRARADVPGNARLLSRIRHSGVAAVLDHGIDGAIPYVVQEFVPGSTLEQVLRDEPESLTAERLTTMVPRIAGAVAALHDSGLTHGALDPKHVVITPGGPVLTVLGVTPLGTGTRADDLRALGDLVHAVGEPLENVRLPEWLLEELGTAVADLSSDDADHQARGLDRLRGLVPPEPRRYLLLGPVRVGQGDAPLATGSPREQAMLCMLLLRDGGLVAVDELIDGIWDAPAPPAARRLVSTYASRLRNALGPNSVRRHTGDGYALPLDLVHGYADVDVLRFRDLAAAVERAHEEGDLDRQHELAASALSLWRGDPLEGVPGPAARAVRAELHTLRQTLLRRTADATTSLSFAFAARPGWQADTLMKLSQAVSELLVQGGAGAEQFELLPRERGWDAAVSADVPMGPLLTAILRELPSLVRRFNRLGLVVGVDVRPPSALPLPDDHATVVVPRALRDTVDDPRFQPFPGTDTWYCQIPAAPSPADDSLRAVLARADAVIFGFDGTLTRLYAPGKARDAALRLLSLVVQERDPEDALGGRPVPRAGGTSEFVHPLDVLRAFADEGSLTVGLHDQLDRIERQAVYGARPTAHSDTVVRLLRGRPRRRRLAVVTDTALRAVATYVTTHGLDIPADHIHCRTADGLAHLLPDPEPLRRILRRLDTTAERSVMIGSTVAEATAARALDLPFIGYAPDDRARERLTAAGARHTVSSLARIADAVRGG
ncbi:SAV_2336 N-terminal domain-related protein [Streptomyces sp. NPDC059063]|uniref:SAV_2336 N-terminal domain-related protein n=1 Tax=unclassified Streptomyces TaxID=2593676 RepID=UPI00368BD677